MGRYSRYDNFYPSYVSVSEKKSRNKKALEKLLKKRGDSLMPVEIAGRKLAKNWWGASWNENLERYADYSNRIERGRSYVRHGAVLDLQISDGQAEALVQGSEGSPYRVEVVIKPLGDKKWKELRAAAASQIDSLAELLAGEFPESLREMFFSLDSGLFPSPPEISFSCTCPDIARMCKHVAAVLYGIGSRLDSAPEKFFSLRGINMDDLVSRVVEEESRKLLDKAGRAGGDDVLADIDIEGVFGIELDTAATGSSGETKVSRKLPSERKPRKGNAKKTKAKPRETSKKQPGGKQLIPGSMTAQLLDKMGRSRKRTYDNNAVSEMFPEWTMTQVRNTISRAVNADLLERLAAGLYRRK